MELPTLEIPGFDFSIPKFSGMPELPKLGEIAPMSAPELASGSMSCGPNDDVATADIYKLKSAMGGKGIKPITSIQELNAEISSSFELMPNIGGAADFMSTANGALVFDKELLTNRILGTSGEFRASFNELNAQLKAGTLMSTFKDKASKMSCRIGDTASLINSSDIGSVKALGSFINKYTGKPLFSGQDKGAIAGLLGSVVTKASDLGISGAFTTLASTVSDNGIIGRMTRAVLPLALKNSDTKLLRELSDSSAGSLINVFSPGFTQNFSKAFTYRGNNSGSLGTFEDVFTSFGNVNSQWSTMERGNSGNVALNLASLIGGSTDFQKLISTGIKYWETEKRGGKTPPVPIDPMMLLANIFQEVTVGNAIHRDFPKVALLSVYDGRLKRDGNYIGTRNNLNSNYLDPRTANGIVGALFGY
jgi:hypothetical protein